jgi:2-polyprenyl-3-methyl-5-hydroxy-6-metoxy-1,4-benzoquinol methylase
MTPSAAPDQPDAAATLAWAGEYSRAFRGLPRFLTAHRPRICPFERLVDAIPAQSSVLDIGCGNGLLLYLLARAGRLREGIGVDIRRDAIDAGNAALRGFGVDRASLCVAGEPSSWPRQAFDAVTMIDVMHHVPPERQRETLEAACAMVRPSGLLVYKDMARSPAWAAWANRAHDLLLARQWIHYLPIAEVESGAAGSKMRLVRSDSARLGWYAHELRVFRREPS